MGNPKAVDIGFCCDREVLVPLQGDLAPHPSDLGESVGLVRLQQLRQLEVRYLRTVVLVDEYVSSLYVTMDNLCFTLFMEVEHTSGYVADYTHILFLVEQLLWCKKKIRK